MARPGRNDPCPCGSGKKYKKCCLDRDRGAETPVFPELEDVRPAEKALLWIHQNFPGEMEAAVVEQYCDGLTEEGLDELRSLPEEVRSMFFLNAHEWVLAEGVTAEGRRFLDIALGEEGPALTASDRLFLEA
ncbi:MAG TPA: SEC-C metal-binding domain-containing protein, partial [Vicinamibacteria bacterium]|nr:SEC-C metal-binding domain-containing protein [Vicinamibacteria bacterium]